MSPRTLVSTVLLVLALPAAQALAASQVLALFASNGATPLTCEGGECSAELSVFCLQEDRWAPRPGTGYQFAEGQDLVLVATAADGTVRRLPAADRIALEAERGYWSVKVSLPESALAGLGAVQVAVEVGAGMSLVPVPLAGDFRPQSEQDVALATGPHRALGARIVEQSGPLVETIGFTGRLINLLPDRRELSEVDADRAWARASRGGGGISEAGLGGARQAFEQCRKDDGRFLRRCLENRHDLMISALTRRYWDAAKEPGS
jgi:hypothetical protein